MSKSSVMKVTCPECGHEQDFTIWPHININQTPEMKEQVLDCQLFVYECDACGKKFPVTYPCMYLDDEKKLKVYLSPTMEALNDFNEAIEETDEAYKTLKDMGYVLRGVTSVNELAEKIMICDAGLDDRVVEIIKMLILYKSRAEGMDIDSVAAMYYYPGKDQYKHEIVIMYKDGTEALVPIDESIIKETWSNMEKRILAHGKKGYENINVEWVTEILQEM